MYGDALYRVSCVFRRSDSSAPDTSHPSTVTPVVIGRFHAVHNFGHSPFVGIVYNNAQGTMGDVTRGNARLLFSRIFNRPIFGRITLGGDMQLTGMTDEELAAWAVRASIHELRTVYHTAQRALRGHTSQRLEYRLLKWERRLAILDAEFDRRAQSLISAGGGQ